MFLRQANVLGWFWFGGLVIIGIMITGVKACTTISPSSDVNEMPYTYYTESFPYFSKIKFVNESLASAILPMQTYPLDEHVGDILKNQTLASSPMTTSDLINVDVNELIKTIGGMPTFPGDDEFWHELLEVTLWQIMRTNNQKTPFPLSEIWQNFDIHQVAEAVHDEYPGYWHNVLLQSLWKEGLKMDYSIMPYLSRVDFVGTTIRLADLNTWAVGVVCPPNFLIKWTVGKLRPEEAAFQIAKDLMEDVPTTLTQLIKSMNLSTPEQYTAYPEGSPAHPSFPAMHSASSAASLWLSVVADLTPEQYCQVLLVDYGIAFARTVAGVHYASDNIAGLNLGQHLVAQTLPGHLAKQYGVNDTAVKAKIAKMRFNWETFDPYTCDVKFSN